MDLVTGRWGDTIYLGGYSATEYIAVLVNYITLATYRWYKSEAMWCYWIKVASVLLCCPANPSSKYEDHEYN